MRSALLGLFAVVLVLAARAAPARAQGTAPGAVRLEYDASAGGTRCPEASALRNTIAAHRAGSDPFSATGLKRVVVTIRRKGAAYVATAVMIDAEGNRSEPREETDPDCENLVETMGAIIWTWLPPPPAAAKPQPTTPTPPALTEKPPAPPPEPEPAPPPKEQTAPPAARPRLRVDAGAFVSFARLPGTAAPGFAASAGLRWPKFSLSLGVEGNLPSSLSSSSAMPPTEVRAWLVVGTLTSCWHPGWFFGCGLATAGAFVADGNDRRGAVARRTAAYGASGVRAGAEVPLPADRLALSFGVDVVVPFSAPFAKVYGVKVWSEPHVGADLGARFVALF
jgi:hypothetical protein